MSRAENPMLHRRVVLTGGVALSLSACAGNLIGPPSPAAALYVLRPEFGPVSGGAPVRQQLVVAVPAAPAALDIERIALERGANVLDYYAQSQWTDRLPLVVQSLLVEGFEKSGQVAAVAREGTGIRADVVLETELRQFEAYYAVPDTPPEIRITMVAKLVGVTNRSVIDTTEVSRTARASANTLQSVIAAFTVAADEALKEIVRWTIVDLSSRHPGA